MFEEKRLMFGDKSLFELVFVVILVREVDYHAEELDFAC